MELWFIYSILSVLSAGLYTFAQKVATERGYPSTLTNLLSSLIALMSAFFVVVTFYGFNGSMKLGLFFAAISGVMYMFVPFFRMEAQKYIDSAILFPLYKTFGPILVLFIGILVFGERFSMFEWVGILFGILVPLMLIHKSEESRQKNLKKGVLLVVASAVFTSIAVSSSKAGAYVFDNVYAFSALTYSFSTTSALIMYLIDSKKRESNGINTKHKMFNRDVIILSLISGVMQFSGFALMMLAYRAGGSLAVVYTINSFYILIPIILSTIIYKEHWNMRKAFAVGLSLLAVAFLH
jgi:drug/metabolite transporter (DMT)-like permease